MAATQKAAGRRQPDDFAQAASDAVAHHGAADLARHREAHARRPFVGARAPLQHERGAGAARAAAHGAKIAAALQPFNDNGGSGLAIRH